MRAKPSARSSGHSERSATGATVGPLIERLCETKARDRMAVIEALGAIGDPRAIEPIIAASQGLDERLVY